MSRKRKTNYEVGKIFLMVAYFCQRVILGRVTVTRLVEIIMSTCRVITRLDEIIMSTSRVSLSGPVK